MDRQMDMFADGGLEQDGGTNDPVSGNEVPPGSTQEEVRDDIPAQLSEGEFVFPADVVRYIGLEKLMMMRQEAKMGLKMMEAMGQMGNSEEATMPDDLPFDINDLDMDDEPEYNVGGFVPAPGQGFVSIPPGIPTPREQVANQQFGISGYAPAPTPTTGFTEAASQQFVQPVTRPAQAYVPTQQVPTPMPTFGEITGPGVPEVDFEFATFRNEAGQEIQLRIKKGSKGELLPGEVLPEGYFYVDPTATATEEVTTTPTAVQTATVREDDPSDPPETPGGATIAFGGNIIPGTTDRVENMFRGNLEVGGLGFNDGRAYAMSTIAPGQQNIPEGGFATITNITLPRPEGVYAGTPQPLGNNMRMDADIFNKYMAGDGKIKVTERATIARAGQHIKEMYTDKGVTGMTVDVDQRMLNQIDQIDEARKQLKEDRETGGGRTSFAITEKDNNGNVTNVATVSKKVAEEIASGVDIEAAAFDYSGFYDDSDSSPSSGGQSFSSGSTDSAFGGDMDKYGFDADDDDLYNAGGLAAKKKPKAKKMKRGGLASKK